MQSRKIVPGGPRYQSRMLTLEVCKARFRGGEFLVVLDDLLAEELLGLLRSLLGAAE